MVGILIVAHQDLGAALRRAAEGIVGPMPAVETLALTYDQDPAAASRCIREALARLDQGQGVLILTDMHGGTPTNLSLPFLQQRALDIVAGVNLPMVLKAHQARGEMPLEALAAFLRDYGARNIVVASEGWRGRLASVR